MSDGNKINAEELMKEVASEIADEFKDKAEEAKQDLKYWGEKIVQLRIAMLTGSAAEIEELKKSEEYAWNAIISLKTKYSYIIEEKSWLVAEKLLKVLKRVILSI